MKTILCFGDSNTHGYVPLWSAAETERRYDENTRWPASMRRRLGAEYRVIEEGLNGRTTIYTPEDQPYKNGENYLLPCLLSHKPIDLVILMLGTNDLRMRFGVTLETLGEGLHRLIDLIRANPVCGAGGESPKILVISPIHVGKPDGEKNLYIDRGEERGVQLSRAFAGVYQTIAEKTGCGFLDASIYAASSVKDGLHMEPDGHDRLSRAVTEMVRQMLAD